MKLLALATPLLVLGLVLLLQRMETWCLPTPATAGRRAGHPADRPASPSTRRNAMSTSTARPPAATVAPKCVKPLLRDPPAPPGYVDPLEGNAVLGDLVEATRGARKPSIVPATHTA